MDIEGRAAVVTGAAGGIGQAVAVELAKRGAAGVALVDANDSVETVVSTINEFTGEDRALGFVGDVTDAGFRERVFRETSERYGRVRICVPAAGITRDALAVKVDRETGKASVYDVDHFRLVVEVNLIAPVYWALQMVADIAEERASQSKGRWQTEEHVQGTFIVIGSISSRGNKGQISYSATKAGLEGAAATLMSEAIFHGVRGCVIHPGFTDTPMVRALGEDFIKERILPQTQLGRLIHPEEIADAICFMITNSAVSGELWADAGWHPAV